MNEDMGKLELATVDVTRVTALLFRSIAVLQLQAITWEEETPDDLDIDRFTRIIGT